MLCLVNFKQGNHSQGAFQLLFTKLKQVTSHKETSAAKHRIQAFAEEAIHGVRYFIQIHFGVIFLVLSISVFGKSTYTGLGQLLAAVNRETEKS